MTRSCTSWDFAEIATTINAAQMAVPRKKAFMGPLLSVKAPAPTAGLRHHRKAAGTSFQTGILFHHAEPNVLAYRYHRPDPAHSRNARGRTPGHAAGRHRGRA